MEIRLKTKILFFALLICVISAMIFGEVIIAYHFDHECTAIDIYCPVCLKINVLNNFLKTLMTASVILYLAALLFSFNIKRLKYLILYPYQLTSVKLKIRSNS